MAGLAVSELEKRNNALLVWNKINKKDGKDNSFELNDGKEVNLKFNPDVKDIGKYFKVEDIEEIKDLSKPKSTKMFFVDTKGNEYKLTDLKKTEEFGGGGGSGGGADDTAVTESTQCYYNALRYKLKTDLNNKNATPAKLKDKSLQSKVFAYQKTNRFTASDLLALHSSGKSKALPTWIAIDDSGTNVYMRTANALASNQKWSGVPYFHRGSPFMAAVYDSKKQALAFDKKQDVRKAPLSGFSDDKWNPGDIWMSSLEPNPSASRPLDFGKGGKSCVLTFEALKKEIFELSKEQKLLGVSLKKVGGTANVSQFNTHPDRTNNVTVDLSSFSFGQTGDFFNSADLYLTFSNNKKMQFRSTATTKSWQGEVKGARAAAGKIGGGGVNFYCVDILGNSIGKGKGDDSLRWTETTFSDNTHFKDMWQLYQKYSKHSKNEYKNNKPVDFATFKSNANGYISKGKNASPAFKFSKYMGLLMLEAIFTKKKGTIKEWSTQVLRYAMSNIDISTYFIKID
jgi:hypothetical protein